MLDMWLGSKTLVIVVVPFVALYAIALLIVWVTHKSPARPYFASCTGIPGPFFASVALLFGLFAAFLANDVQRRNANAETAVFREGEGIRTILRLSEAVGREADPVKRASIAYLEFVLNEELPKMRQHGSVPNKLGAVRNLSSAVLAASLPPAVQTAMIESLVTVREARPQALALFVFTTAFATTIALIGVGERPFSNRIIDDEPLREALTSASN